MTSFNRRTFLAGTGGVAAGLAAFGLAGCASGTTSPATDSATAAAISLTFDSKAFTEITTKISTATGEKEVVYHFWKPITYVGKPVDAKYQSLVVSVPVKIDGVPIDASKAPVILANAVGGYFPASVSDAAGVGEGKMVMGSGGPGGAGGPGGPGGPGGMPSGMPPGGPAGGGTPPAGGPGGDANAMVGGNGQRVSLARLALAAGYVVVEPGCRGRTLVDSGGTYYGVAPAALVDLKAAVRYLKANKDVIPGDMEKIVTTGVSAGGALSSLLGASGDSKLYDTELAALAAAPGSDTVFATGAWCPITDLEHADMAYEWNWSTLQSASGSTDAEVSKELAKAFSSYQSSLGLTAKGFGQVTADNYGEYLLKTYLQPGAATYLDGLSESDRATYLDQHKFITYTQGKATFTWQDYLTHVGTRKKTGPAFDAFDLSTGENNLFGTGTTKARHFTEYSLRHASNDQSAKVDSDIVAKLDQMNPMHHLADQNPGRAKKWWIRVGAKDTDTALTVVGNLALKLENLGDSVSTKMYWDQGHGANQDAADFIVWVKEITT